MKVVKAVVPAAGLSRRFGGPNKLLLPWGESTVIGTVAEALRKAGVEAVFVTGRDAEQVAKAVQPSTAVFNPRYQEGIGTSIAAGMKAVGQCDGVLITLGDMPGLQPKVIHKLIEEFDGESIVRATYADQPDKPSHPIIFPTSLFPELLQLTGDAGGQSIINNSQHLLKLIEFEGSLPDMDSLKDSM